MSVVWIQMNVSKRYKKIHQFEFFSCRLIPSYGRVPEVPKFCKFLKNYFEFLIRSTEKFIWQNINFFAKWFHRSNLKGSSFFSALLLPQWLLIFKALCFILYVSVNFLWTNLIKLGLNSWHVVQKLIKKSIVYYFI